jgi:integrase
VNLLAVASSRTIFDSLDITEDTKRDYLARLPQFLGFISRNGITRDLLLDYKKYLRSRTDLSVSTKNKQLAVARITLRELYRRGAISADLSQGIKSFEQSNRHRVNGLTDNEVERVCQYLRNADDSFSIARLRVIVALLLFQGLRTVEICRLNVGDVDLVNSTLLVLGKGRDDRESINLHPETAKALTTYIRDAYVKDGPLFYSLLGKQRHERLTTRGLRLIVTNLFEQLGIDRTVHGCRHWYATRLISEYKSDLARVAKYTRHRSLEMLSVYNDSMLSKQDLPRYYAVFTEVLGS